MRKTLNGLRRAATVVMAAAAVTATTGIPSAHAAIDDYCGANTSVSGVYTRACWYPLPSQPGMWVPSAKMRIPSPLDPAKWTYCELRIAVFKRAASASTWTRTGTTYGDCLPSMQATSANGQPSRLGDSSKAMYPNPNTCYYVLARWIGTYNGQPVGMRDPSFPFPKSLNLCGDNTTVAPITADGDVPFEPPVETPTVTVLPIVGE